MISMKITYLNFTRLVNELFHVSERGTELTLDIFFVAAAIAATTINTYFQIVFLNHGCDNW